MTKRLALIALSTALLTGCGKAAPMTAVAAQVHAAQAASAKTFVVKSFSAKVDEEQGSQTFTIEGTCKDGAFSFETSTFWPYYVPMFGSAKLNGEDVKVTPAVAKQVLAVIKGAKVPSSQAGAFQQLNLGLDFIARRDG